MTFIKKCNILEEYKAYSKNNPLIISIESEPQYSLTQEILVLVLHHYLRVEKI